MMVELSVRELRVLRRALSLELARIRNGSDELLSTQVEAHSRAVLRVQQLAARLERLADDRT